MNKDACFQIGYVAKTHGLKGEVTLVLTEAIELESIESVFIEIRHTLVPYFIEEFSDRQDKVFVKFEEVNNPEQAAQLKGCGIFMEKTWRPKPKRGEFYDDEVIGFSVEDEVTGKLGNITGIMGSGNNRLLQVDQEGKEILIPVNSPFIISVNRTKKRIGVSLPEGFLEI